MSYLKEFLEANERYAAQFSTGDLEIVPKKPVIVVTCIDARIDPAKALGLKEGDAHVVRIAGGLAVEALRSLILSTHLLGTREILVIHHTDCGMTKFTNDEVRKKLRSEFGVDASNMDFLPFSDIDESVRKDVAFVRSSPYLPKDITVHGFVFDVRTGRLREVR